MTVRSMGFLAAAVMASVLWAEAAGDAPQESMACGALQDAPGAPSPPVLVPAPVPVVDPPGLVHYMGRKIAAPMSHLAADWLIRNTREVEENTTRMLEALELKEGQTVCDFGCGNGYHTLRMLPMVGAKGSVYGTEIQEQMLDLLEQRRVQRNVAGHLVPVLSTLSDPKLPPDTFDLILMVDVYHELSHPEHVLKGVRASLRPQGRLVLVEFRKDDPKVPIKVAHTMHKEQILKEIVPNGFCLVRQFDELPWQHMMFFERDPEMVVPEPGTRDPSVYTAPAADLRPAAIDR